MKTPSFFLWSLVFLLLGCESAHDKIARLQSELLSTVSSRDYFEIKANKQTVRLPLPLEPARAKQKAEKIVALSTEASAIVAGSLNDADQLRLKTLCSQLIDLKQAGEGISFDPANYVFTEVLRQNSDPAFWDTFLLQVPAYYAEVERRWQTPQPNLARAAAAQSLQTLDLLNGLDGAAIPARMAVKDFVGHCHSAACLE